MGTPLVLILATHVGLSGCKEESEPTGSERTDADDARDEDDTGPGGQSGEKDKEREPEPQPREVRSEQGAGCNVKNDCQVGHSCIRGVCQPARFGLEATAKECVQIDCSDSTDCCGSLPTVVPEKCKSRAAKCVATLPGCLAQECNRSSDCAGGGVCTGNCSVSSGECRGNADCFENTCVQGACTIDFAACKSDAECRANTCAGGTCECENPSYDPADPICDDEECDEICLWACEESRCVIPTDCDQDDDCFGATPLCSEGTCVACTRSADCSFGKLCLGGRCETACSDDSHCPLFEACQKGECIYVGCRSHRECTLVPSVEQLGIPSGSDPRLLSCNTGDDGIGRCIVPCQTDAQCPATEVCEGGVCEYIGCDTNSECKTILGLHDQEVDEETPWVPRVECRSSEAEMP